MGVLIAMDVEQSWLSLPQGMEPIFCKGDPESISRHLSADIRILVTDAMPQDISGCEGLQWIQLVSSGTDQLTGHPLMKQKIRVSNASGICAVHIAEYIVAQLLRHTKKFDALADLERQQRWPASRLSLATRDLRGQRALLIGYGGVGRETARLLKPFGVHLTAVQRTPGRSPYRGYMPYPGIGDPDGSLPDETITPDELYAALPKADIVVLSVPLDKATYRLMNAPMFARMKANSILINISRGPVVDTQALLEALNGGTLAHAFLDVFDQEPLPERSELWSHPRITVTPHMAGVMPNAAEKLERLFVANYERFQAGEPLINELDRSQFLSSLI